MTRSDLLAAGWSTRAIAAAVHRGDLLRLRRGHYSRPDVDPAIARAVRVGGRLACVSELRRRGIWVLDDGRLHVRLRPNAARLRDADDRFARFRPTDECVLHWVDLVDDRSPLDPHVSAVDALIESTGCLEPLGFVAALDSALRIGAIHRTDLGRIASAIPIGCRGLVGRVDASAESGLETIVRELCRDLGYRVATQVGIEGVGRVDLELEGAVVVECDGAQFHDAAVTSRDRRRDAGAVLAGRTVLHFRYDQIVYDRALVARTIIAAVAAHRSVRNSGELTARALRRAKRLGFS